MAHKYCILSGDIPRVCIENRIHCLPQGFENLFIRSIWFWNPDLGALPVKWNYKFRSYLGVDASDRCTGLILASSSNYT